MKLLEPNLSEFAMIQGPDGAYRNPSEFFSVWVLGLEDFNNEPSALVLVNDVPFMKVDHQGESEAQVPASLDDEVTQAHFFSWVGELHSEVGEETIEEFVIEHGLEEAFNSRFSAGDGHDFVRFAGLIYEAMAREDDSLKPASEVGY